MENRPKIMIVDDDPTNIEIVTEILEESYEIRPVYSGEEALEEIYSFKPDIVLLDIMMPGIDGYEVCKIIRADEQIKDITILLVSAKAMAKEMKRGFEVGADDYITKPFEHDDLALQIAKHVKNRNQ
ncbi:MAG: response regulator [Deltaproteobacteria bacterium]|jgi:CheY-like chemotaxis protein|nr:response regulator [Deltaproteobacteria bacterium]MBT4527580.1 response regulator [Deltaproteobacteria bacterium]